MQRLPAVAALVLLTACAPAPKAPNVLLVSMDTVRFDRTSFGGGRDTTPELAALAAEGEVWPDAWTVGNESIYSHAALFTGRYPSEVALPDYGSFAVPASVPTLAEALRAYGYRTAAFTGGGHVIAAFGFDHGFDSFQTATGDTRAGSFFDTVPLARDWIAHHGDAPWFVFVHGYDAHSPYVQPGPFHHLYGAEGATERIEKLAASPKALEQLRGHRWYPDRVPADFLHAAGPRVLGLSIYTEPADPRPGERVVELTDAEVQHLRDHYDTGLSYADLWLGTLLADVDLSTTLVIVVSDHGEDLLDHGFANHRAGLWDSTLHVPLVVAGPGFAKGRVHEERVDLRSVVPTVLRAIGGEAPAGAVAAPLQDGPDEPVVFAEGVMDQVSARSDAGRLVVRDVGLAAGAPRLATLTAGDATVSWYAEPDPEPRPAPDGALLDAMRTWRAGLHPASETGAAVPPAVRKALSEQGYWTPGDPAP